MRTRERGWKTVFNYRLKTNLTFFFIYIRPLRSHCQTYFPLFLACPRIQSFSISSLIHYLFPGRPDGPFAQYCGSNVCVSAPFFLRTSPVRRRRLFLLFTTIISVIVVSPGVQVLDNPLFFGLPVLRYLRLGKARYSS